MRDIEFFVLHDGEYPFVPHNDEIGQWSRTNFISLPTEFYDGPSARRMLDDFLDTFVLAEKLGFDGVLHSEQHNGPIGLSGSGLTLSAYIAAVTSNIKIAAVGPIMNAYQSPIRLAEEVALVDQLSNGRLVLGLPMGTGMQYHSYGNMNPAFARERWNEAHELLIAAMTRPGPFDFQGKHFHVPYVNLWPRPVQAPHPPIFIPAAGSRETLELTAKHRYTYQAVLNPRAALKRNCDLFRELCEQNGYEADPRQISVNLFVHVAETDEQARREVEPHIMWLMQNFFRSTFQDSFPPGHVSLRSLRGMVDGGYRSKPPAEMTWDDLVRERWIVVGSPETVAAGIEEIVDELGAGRVCLSANNGTEPLWMIHKSLTLFAEQVLPRFRPKGAAPTWAREPQPIPRTRAELAVRSQPRRQPQAEIEGVGIVETLTAHVPELRRAVRDRLDA
ncbi:LLM class flavin-dependent oxidoreductase [Conexibacter arvalis]|uniref:Alkanesulfonate monooxygenase SsuD/methylene tetrahydromethanopterin reductase-like flavin-dependent oxidoreductase (Luciferase family) n=1 Tax=Conexibacter arvalis TaxID=912552 RepID=A0A840IB87_9ACTN|nr:LLM class flavin-dependent oxidoreductase [Conexibacter arvalis]MBB4662159.1 alkanesulfonate monooxygenase SsuD/methylene tetrahydromethanopterin reductase-like flavin-dependent oxidoreductase (luciferase family) [Conexibacter arvalis]